MEHYEIVISKKAQQNLYDIYKYIAVNLSSPENAAKQYYRIKEAVLSLNTMPKRVPLSKLQPFCNIKLRQLIVDNYSVFFYIKENNVMITNIIYTASNLLKNLT